MSREVDTSDLSQLSYEDLVYLRDRGELTPDQIREFGLVPRTAVVQGPAMEDTPNIGDVGTRQDAGGFGGEESPVVNKARATQPYSDWSTDELREEARLRELRTSGNKGDLMARLLDDDESDDTDGDDDDDDDDDLEEEG